MNVSVEVTTAAEKAVLTDGSFATGAAIVTAGDMFSGTGATIDFSTVAGSIVDNLDVVITSANAAPNTVLGVLTGTEAAGDFTLTITLNASNAAITLNELQTGIRNTDTTAVDGVAAAFANVTVTDTGGGLDTLNGGAAVSGFFTAAGGGTSATATNVVRRVHDRVVQITGNKGSEVFTFGTGTTQTQMSNQINALTASTGVTATVTNGNLVLNSEGYGTDAFVDVEVISELAIGNYAESTAVSYTHLTLPTNSGV